VEKEELFCFLKTIVCMYVLRIRSDLHSSMMLNDLGSYIVVNKTRKGVDESSVYTNVFFNKNKQKAK